MTASSQSPISRVMNAIIQLPVRAYRNLTGSYARKAHEETANRIGTFQHQITHGYLEPTQELLDLVLRRLHAIEGSLGDQSGQVSSKLATLEEQVSLLRTHLYASGILGPMNRKTKELEALFRQADSSAQTGAAVVEIGCMRYAYESPTEGASTLYFARWCRDSQRPFYSIDTELNNLDNARRILDKAGLSATFIQARGEDALNSVETPICLLYLDGSDVPAETLAQFQIAEKKLAPGAVVAIDDVQQMGTNEFGKGTAAATGGGTRGSWPLNRVIAWRS